MAHQHKPDSLLKRLDYFVVFKVKVTGKVQNLSECSSGQYRTAEPFVTKLDKVMHHHGSVSCKRTVCKITVTVRAHTIKYDCFYHITELLISLQPSLIGWYIILSWSVFCKNWIVVSQVKVTMMSIESLCILDPLCH